MEELISGVRKIEYKGTFKKKEFATILRDALESFGYSINEKDVEGASDKLKFKWVCEKNFDDYTKARIDIKTSLKESGSETSAEIDFKAKLFTDYRNNWEKHPAFKIFKEIYDSTIYKSTLNKFKDRINSDMTSIIDEVKSFLNMYRIK